MTVPRIKTFVRNLDEKMEGGIPEKSIVLVCGTTGSMKSTLSYSILYKNVVQEKKRAMYVTLEQSRSEFMEHMARFNMDKSADPETDAALTVLDIAEMRRYMKEANRGDLDWYKSLITQISFFLKKFTIDLLVLDSLPALYSISEMHNPRDQLFHFFRDMKERGITTLMIAEMPPDKLEFGRYGVESFLSDGVIHLDVRRGGSAVNLYLGVVKMRKTAHDRNYFPFLYGGKDGFEIVVK